MKHTCTLTNIKLTEKHSRANKEQMQQIVPTLVFNRLICPGTDEKTSKANSAECESKTEGRKPLCTPNFEVFGVMADEILNQAMRFLRWLGNDCAMKNQVI